MLDAGRQPLHRHATPISIGISEIAVTIALNLCGPRSSTGVAYCLEAEGRAAGCLDARRKPRTPSAVGVADLLQVITSLYPGRSSAEQLGQFGKRCGSAARSSRGRALAPDTGQRDLVTRGRDRGVRAQL